MSEIIKTKAVVLKKMDYGDSSRIVSLFTEDYGRMSAIIRGARSPKSKSGRAADLLNNVEVVIYVKESRDIQLISQLDLISNYSSIKEDLLKLKYASAVIELTLYCTIEHEKHVLLYRGIVRILDLLNSSAENPKLLFAKFFLFFLKEIGYEFQTGRCSNCSKKLNEQDIIAIDFWSGLLCSSCRRGKNGIFELSKELFILLTCLSSKNTEINFSDYQLDKTIGLLERYLKHHMEEFKGLKSLNLF